MYVVIFRAVVGDLDADYTEAIERMEQLAFEEYGCLEFCAVAEGENRIAISYWETEEAILRWKSNSEHFQAQAQGRAKWYKSYSVQVVEVQREYSHNK